MTPETYALAVFGLIPRAINQSRKADLRDFAADTTILPTLAQTLPGTDGNAAGIADSLTEGVSTVGNLSASSTNLRARVKSSEPSPAP